MAKLTADDGAYSDYFGWSVANSEGTVLVGTPLKKNKGSIVLFSTVAARKGFLNHSIISSAKAAVEGLTVALAAEFAPNVRVNCIAPSLSKSKMAGSMLKNEKMAESIAKMHALKRIGEGDDFSSLVNFLLSKDSSWITGQIIGVDGGRSSVA